MKSDGIAVLKTIGNLWKNYKPFHFFTILAMILTALDTIIFFPYVFIPYLHTGLVERFPTLILCGFIMVAAMMSFFTGMILDNIIKKEKREFEFRLQLAELINKEGM